MTQISEENKKLFSGNAVFWAMFLCGPYAGIFLLSENFKRMGKYKEAKRTFWFGAVICGLIFVCLCIFSNKYLSTFLNFIFSPIIYVVLIVIFINKLQGDDLKKHFSEGWEKETVGKVFLVSLKGLGVLIVYFILLIGFLVVQQVGLKKAFSPEMVGVYYESQGDFVKAISVFKKAADRGSVTAECELGNIYSEECPTLNYPEALIWYKKAAEAGSADAMRNIDQMFFEGQGVKQDYKQALDWTHKAVESGSVDAECDLGVAYVYGRGVEKNVDEAKTWLKKAADSGSEEAKNNLIILAKQEDQDSKKK